jgi:hypothetical protein
MSGNNEYINIVNKMFPSKPGTLKYYFKLFLILKKDKYWTQPQAIEFCNNKVLEDGGVKWYSNKGPKINPDGTLSTFGDPGRTLEKIRTEEFENCFDSHLDNREGPFRLNIDKYKKYTGSTKNHIFSKKIKNEIKKRSNNKCELCGHKGTLEFDHFIPKEKGGKSIIENASYLCSRCNDKKCNKEPTKFMIEVLSKQMDYFIMMGLENELKNFMNIK